MLRWISVAICSFLMFAGVAAADTVTLRSRIEANGAMVTLGDAFVGTGALSSRPIAPAPPAGQVGSIPMAALTAAASVAGFDFTPPAGVDAVQVVHPSGARAMIAPTSGPAMAASVTPPIASRDTANITYPNASSVAAIHRGDAVMLVYQSGGITLTMRTQAMQDAAVGQSVRLMNPSSNRVVLGVVTGPGAASASP
ncbi:MAG: flagellar basal body P-ring formation protein FlgA [Proteobacteria bacterium]|nr:flagellar basal body P-ring formation protein FlgA [Pseudomonadota bacterium]